eukprot:CAMPEP_0178818316 /NCGR_PEP_ID=MMETSP0746-20121128/2366_1 /TAXON_ID=913974 /ORGANISM="Nitzschia punctata, Strain CCMP561" /LENGTH=118 /DNA_ID=CAMNT_0020479491 /DNA_START=59 /DNA_END=415 /DNA_ORIENTATION=-
MTLLFPAFSWMAVVLIVILLKPRPGTATVILSVPSAISPAPPSFCISASVPSTTEISAGASALKYRLGRTACRYGAKSSSKVAAILAHAEKSSSMEKEEELGVERTGTIQDKTCLASA